MAAGIGSQRELLDLLSEIGVVYTESFWSKVENGQRRPSREHLVEILRCLKEQGAPLDAVRAQEVIRDAGYASLDDKEMNYVLQEDKARSDVLLGEPTVFFSVQQLAGSQDYLDYSILAAWVLYMEILELWRNIGWSIYHSPDLNWKGMFVPVLVAFLIFLVYRFSHNNFVRAVITAVFCTGTGIVMILTVHRPGIIIPVLSTLGGVVVAGLVFSHGPSYILPSISTMESGLIKKTSYDHDVARTILIVSLWGVSLLIFSGIAMNVILFMAPPDAFDHMPHGLRVFRGVEILLAIVTVLGILGVYWFLPLVRFLGLPRYDGRE